MLLIPVSGKLNWRNPPVATIALILVNVLVFVLLQSEDNERFHQAEYFYFESGLVEIEIPLYLAHLENQGKSRVPKNMQDLSDQALFEIHRQMESDHQFLDNLRGGRVLPRDSGAFRQWRQLRQEYEQLLSKAVFYCYGFRPKEARPITFLTYMFLHGGFDHLLGNMIFLWILGCVLELGCGRNVYLGVYLVGGVLSVVLYWFVYRHSATPLVGASGAIAALMGAYTILFGKKKVNIFYSLGFYFNTIKIPALFLFPLWVGNELYQLFYGGVSHVAYMAHIGGLVGGALLGLAALKSTARTREELFEKKPEDEIAPLMASALERIGTLDFEQARGLLNQVLEKDPQNLTALTHLFNIEKNEPENPRFHQTAGKLLDLQAQDSGSWDQAYQTYAEYLRLARQPRLNFPLFLRLSTVCAATGHTDKAGQLITALIRKRADMPGISTALLRLANAYKNKGQPQDYKKCLQLIFKLYPDSPEAQIVKKG